MVSGELLRLILRTGSLKTKEGNFSNFVWAGSSYADGVGFVFGGEPVFAEVEGYFQAVGFDGLYEQAFAESGSPDAHFGRPGTGGSGG